MKDKESMLTLVKKIDSAIGYVFGGKHVANFARQTANFARLYYPHFTTFRNETSEYY
jgi:hypothetical protein